jgi:hypothetical protein
MFTQAGPRPFWPAIVLFLPWLVLGVGYLLGAARHKLHRVPSSPQERVRALLPSRARRLHAMSLFALLLFGAAQVVFADPVESRACEAIAPREASAVADKLFEKGDYQRAGECYQVAGDLARANLAFLKAAGPKSQDTAKGLKAQGDTAKALFANAAQAFKKNH